MTPLWVIEKKNKRGRWEVDFGWVAGDALACQSKRSAVSWCKILRERDGGEFRPRKYVPAVDE